MAQARATSAPHSAASSTTQPAPPHMARIDDGTTIITRKLRPDGSGKLPGPRVCPSAFATEPPRGLAGSDTDIARMQDVLSDDDAPSDAPSAPSDALSNAPTIIHDAEPDTAEFFSTAPQLVLRDLHDAPLPPPPPPFEPTATPSSARRHADPVSPGPPTAKAFPTAAGPPTTASITLHIPPPPSRPPPTATDPVASHPLPPHDPLTEEPPPPTTTPSPMPTDDDTADHPAATHTASTTYHEAPATHDDPRDDSAAAASSPPPPPHLIPARFIGDRRLRHARRPAIYITQSGHIQAPRATREQFQEWRNTVIHRIPEETLLVRTPLGRPFRSPGEVSDEVPFIWKMHPQDAVVAAHLLCSTSPLLCQRLLYAVHEWSPLPVHARTPRWTALLHLPLPDRRPTSDERAISKFASFWARHVGTAYSDGATECPVFVLAV